MSKERTSHTARRWFAQEIEALGRPVHILVPNQRLALFLARDWASQQRQEHQVWQPLAIQPWREWLLSLWQSYSHQQGLLGKSTPRLLNAEEVLRLWDEITQGRHAEDALEADRFCREWSLVYSIEECNDHQRQHVQWQAQYQKFKESHELFDETDVLLWLCDLLQNSSEKTDNFIGDLPVSVLCYGFIEFSPLQTRFLEALEASGTEVIRGFDQQPITNGSARFEQWVDPEAELKGAAQWAKDTWLELASERQSSGEHSFNADNWFDGPRVAVIIPDLAQHQDEIKSVMSDVLQWQTDLESKALPWTISAGKSLSDYPLMATLLNILDLCFDDIASQDLEALLRSPHWGAGRLAPFAARLLEPLRATGRRRWRLAEFHFFLVHYFSGASKFNSSLELSNKQNAEKGVLEQETKASQMRDELFQWLDELLALSQSSAYNKMHWKDWLHQMMQCINTAVWPGSALLSSVDFQLMQRWHKWWLSQSQEAPLVESAEQAMSYGQTSHRLKKLWRELMFQPEAETDRILVLGMLEAAALPLDAVYILRLSAEYWPAASKPNPFLPYEAQRSASLPRSTPLREVWYSEALLRLYSDSCRSSNSSQASGQMVLSFSSSRDDVPQFPSPILRSVFGSYTPVLKDSIQWQDRLVPSWSEPDDALTAFQGLTPLVGGAYALGQQGLCPFLGALALRVRAQPIAYTQRAITAADRGRWMHKALELVWQALQSQTALIQMDHASLGEMLNRVIDKILEQAAWDLPSLMTPVTTEIEKQRLKALVLASLELEKERAPFSVQGIEVKYPLHVADFSFDLRLDRWDLDKDQWVLVDYKSSKPSSVEDRQLAPQLLLYGLSLAQQKGVSEADIPLFLGQAVYMVLKPSTGVQWINVVEPHESVASWFTHEYNLLLALLEEVRSGKSTLEPYQGDKTCKPCGYQSYCRTKQRAGQKTSQSAQQPAGSPV